MKSSKIIETNIGKLEEVKSENASEGSDTEMDESIRFV